MAVSHGKHLLTGALEPLGEGGFLGRWGSHGSILDCIPVDMLQLSGAAEWDRG